MYKVGYIERNLRIRIAKIAFHAKVSPIRTREEVFGLCVFIAHQSGPWIAGRTPEDPLVQDSLGSP